MCVNVLNTNLIQQLRLFLAPSCLRLWAELTLTPDHTEVLGENFVFGLMSALVNSSMASEKVTQRISENRVSIERWVGFPFPAELLVTYVIKSCAVKERD